ncbi:MAG: hypothetical protein FJ150_04085 [Euryarchaeota archaeon]|nr:hypothetical protein [Euryarchaeota archaeon]
MLIKTPSRLHVALIDLNGFYGRIDGGVGITLKKPRLILEAEPTNGNIQVIFNKSRKLSRSLMNDYEGKIKSATKKMMDYLGIEGGYKFIIRKTYPPHSGLGSGTQLSLAVGKILSQFHEQYISAHEIARIVGRGGTSGIGVGAFDYGGFIIDGGHSIAEKSDFLPSAASKAYPPPILVRYDFPEDWNLILVIPNIDRRISGSKEVNIFQKYCPIPLKDVRKLSHLILMNMMPAVVEEDIISFGSAINSIQNIGFKKIELQLQKPIVNEIIAKMRAAGASGAGMSSFGPTVYAVTDTNKKEIRRAAYDSIKDVGGEVILTKAQNSGLNIKT